MSRTKWMALRVTGTCHGLFVMLTYIDSLSCSRTWTMCHAHVHALNMKWMASESFCRTLRVPWSFLSPERTTAMRMAMHSDPKNHQATLARWSSRASGSLQSRSVRRGTWQWANVQSKTSPEGGSREGSHDTADMRAAQMYASVLVAALGRS